MADLLVYIFISVLIILPTWKILSRVGLNPLLALLILVPIAGELIVLGILAFARWPRIDNGEGYVEI